MDISGSFAGGITGYAVNISAINIINATNTGNVNGESYNAGGLIGYENNSNRNNSCIYIKNCSNEGSVTAKDSTGYIGGLVGYTQDSNAITIYIIQSCNTGDINCTNAGGASRGGLIGCIGGRSSDNKNVYIKSSYNTGNIIGLDNSNSGYNGGLIGQSGGNQLQIEQSYNTGKIDKCGYIGGLIGLTDSKSTRIYKCYNSGFIECSERTGGLIGQLSSSSTNINIQDSDNLGNIVQLGNYELSRPEVGGIIGYSYSSCNIENCSNQGDIVTYNAEDAYHGGLIGLGGGTIKGSSNSGDITAVNVQDSFYIGGLVGSGTGNIQTCDNSGDITVNGKGDSQGYSFAGGIVGYTSSGMNVSNAYNTGDLSISSSFAGIYAGGILGGPSNLPIISCYNEGDIKYNGSVSGYLYEGGIAGNNSALIQDCYNTGEINSHSNSSSSQGYMSTYIGGIVGEGNAIVNCYNTASVCDDISFCNTSNNNYVGPIYGKSGNSGTNYYEEDIDVVGKVQGSRNYCTACSEEYMKSEEFFNIIKGKGTKWIHEENQYPTLDIAVLNNSSEVTELTIGNNKETFDITTQIGSSGGTVNGSYTSKYIAQNNIKWVETVKYGEKSTKTIDIKPNSNYIIQKITVNGEEIGFTIDEQGKCTLPKGYFENVTEDINIVAYFVKKSGSIIINKEDKEGNRLAGAKFKLESDAVTESNVLRDLTKNGDYGFKKDDRGYIVPEANIPNGSTASSYYVVDLKSETEPTCVVMNVHDGSNGTLYATIAEDTEAPEADENEDFLYMKTSNNKDEYFVSELLEPGKIYYLHLGFDCTSTYYDSQYIYMKTIKAVTVSELECELCGDDDFEEENNGYVVENVTDTGNNAYIPIDLTEMSGNYQVEFDISLNNITLWGRITEEEDIPTFNYGEYFMNIYENKVSKTSVTDVLKGGKKYYLHIKYSYRANSESVPGMLEISNIKLLEEITGLRYETNPNGQIIEQVPDGTYTITEIKAPEGYSINKEPQTCTVSSADETSKEVTIKDDKLKEVVIHYYLKNTNDKNQSLMSILRNDQLLELKDPVHIYGNLGEDYNTSEYIETELQGYTLEVDENNEYVIPDNATGTFDEKVTHVNYYYEKTANQLTNLSITKKWNLPEDIVNDYRATLKLMKIVNDKTTPVTDANGNEITRTIRGNGTELIENLPKYEDGTQIQYTVEEIQVEKLKSINNETQEETWEEVPLSQFKATYEVKEKE